MSWAAECVRRRGLVNVVVLEVDADQVQADPEVPRLEQGCVHPGFVELQVLALRRAARRCSATGILPQMQRLAATRKSASQGAYCMGVCSKGAGHGAQGDGWEVSTVDPGRCCKLLEVDEKADCGCGEAPPLVVSSHGPLSLGPDAPLLDHIRDLTAALLGRPTAHSRSHLQTAGRLDASVALKPSPGCEWR